jgi:polysaccharide pyruvyl transferase WcaK-like protein
VLRLARLLRKPAVVFAQSLGPLSDVGEDRVKRVLRGIPLGLRDQPSLELAARLGLPARSVADTALLLPPCGTAAGDADGADVPGERGAGASGALVLVPRAGYPAVCNVLRELGRRHLDAGGRLRIVLLHPAADEPEGRRLHARLPGAELVVPATVAAARSALRGAHAIVSGRLHGMVFGATCGVPVAGLAYDPKVAGFGAEVGAPVVPVPSGGEDGSREAAVTALVRFAADPRLDVAAVERMTARARAGVRWLLDEVLHVGSSNAP